MTALKGSNTTLRGFYLISSIIATGFTLLIICSAALLFRQEERTSMALARNEAAATFNKDQAFRSWATMHGGVYVPVTEITSPNPNLSHIPERDITSPSGRRLTLMNPAYMMKQTMMVYHDLYGIVGHITSLKPLNSGNAPDPWERKALEAFGRGKKEVTEVIESNGKLYFRFMKPMITQEGCLKCHGLQGYATGDIRGGVGVMVPMASYLAHEKSNKALLGLSFLFVWLLGMTGIGFGFIKARSGILEQKSGEDEIRRLNSELEQRVNERTIQLSAINQELEAFSYSVSHDLRAPLRSIDGFSQALLEEYGGELDTQGSDYLKRVRDATQHMGQIIDDLLKLSRMTRSEMTAEEVNLSENVRAITVKLRESEPQRQVEFIIEENLVALGDERLLRVALENLLGNAWKFTGKQHNAVIEFGMTTCGGRSAYFVRDNGAGFDMAYADKLFNPFQRLHSDHQFPGTGIGLATVKRIVNRHAGRVWAEGEPEQGATFYFTLSLIDGKNRGSDRYGEKTADRG